MKKLLLLLPLAFAAILISAQIPNSDMEFWSNAPNLLYWQTNSYPLTLPPYDPYVVKKDSDRYSGNWAADYYGNGVFKPWGITAFPVSQHPASLSLYYKLLFPPCVNGTNPLKDTVSVLVELLSHGAVVDNGYWQSTSANTSYMQLVVPVSQNATVFDSCRITVTGGKVSTACSSGVFDHTEFKVDHFQLSYSNSAGCIDSTHICDTCVCFTLYQPVCGCNGVTYSNSCMAYNAGVNSWSAGSCTSTGCIDSSRICDTCICPLAGFPVCGCNGVTYINTCYAINAGILYWTTGACNSNTGCSAYYNYTPDSAGLGISFADASSGTYDSLRWSFGDGISVTTGITSTHHTYAHSGLYNVCLTIFSRDSSCSNTYCQMLAVAPAGPCPDTALIHLDSICNTLYSPVCGCNGVTYSNACEAFYHYGVASWRPGTCQVPLLCQANYSYWLDSTGFTAHFQYSSTAPTGGTGNINGSLLWNFGDGTSDTGLYPIHTYTDTTKHAYWVCLTINDSIDSCTNTFCDSVRVGHYVYGCYAGFGYSFDSTGVVTVYPDSLNGGSVTGSGWIVGSDSINGTPTFHVDSTSSFIVCYVVMNDSMRCSDTACISAQQLYMAYAAHLATEKQELSSQLSQIYLYPNPTAGFADLRFNANSGIADITVRNSLGEAVYQLASRRLSAGSNVFTLNLSGLSGGVYLVEIRMNSSIAAVRKLVKM